MKLCVESAEGLPTCLNLSLQDIGWFDNTQVQEDFKEAQNFYGSQLQV